VEELKQDGTVTGGMIPKVGQKREGGREGGRGGRKEARMRKGIYLIFCNIMYIFIYIDILFLALSLSLSLSLSPPAASCRTLAKHFLDYFDADVTLILPSLFPSLLFPPHSVRWRWPNQPFLKA